MNTDIHEWEQWNGGQTTYQVQKEDSCSFMANGIKPPAANYQPPTVSHMKKQ
jgi:hypothetical protein